MVAIRSIDEARTSTPPPFEKDNILYLRKVAEIFWELSVGVFCAPSMSIKTRDTLPRLSHTATDQPADVDFTTVIDSMCIDVSFVAALSLRYTEPIL